MFYWEAGEGLVAFQSPLPDNSNLDKWCYFCNAKTHGGRECPEAAKVIRFELFTQEVISEWDEGITGDLKEGFIFFPLENYKIK